MMAMIASYNSLQLAIAADLFQLRQALVQLFCDQAEQHGEVVAVDAVQIVVADQQFGHGRERALGADGFVEGIELHDVLLFDLRSGCRELVTANRQPGLFPLRVLY
jgi:hypothetical protein